MRIAIASDHAGFIQKGPMIDYIQGLGHEVIDLGPETDDRCDYPDYADRVARMVAEGQADRGVQGGAGDPLLRHRYRHGSYCR